MWGALDQLDTWQIYLLLIVLGLLIGSFLNVCIYRLPREKSVVRPRSFCPKCRTPIKWYDNIPLISYIILLGRCRSCRRSIPIRYPLVELCSAFFLWFLFFHFDAWKPCLIYYFLLIAPLIVVTFIDLEHRIIPDVISIPGIVAGALSQFLLMHGSWDVIGLDVLLGVVVGGGFLALVGFGYEFLKKREGLGGGDIKLAAMLGAFFGWKGIIFILFMSSVVGSFVGVILLTVFKKDTKFAIPYGPFLAIGAIVYLFWGEWILNWYFGLV